MSSAKNVHVVNNILESFKTGKKDMAEFWINMNGGLIHIRYFAVRAKDGKYLGTMEITQDITDIKKIEGEKRLLDWKDYSVPSQVHYHTCMLFTWFVIARVHRSRNQK